MLNYSTFYLQFILHLLKCIFVEFYIFFYILKVYEFYIFFPFDTKFMNNSLWTEKYRPKSPESLQLPPHLGNFLKHAIKNGFPHLLLYGPPGTGKTTFAGMLEPTLILNASDDRGIAVVRDKIKKIANTVKRQVIVLDECENLTRDSQTCLRRILEDYQNTSFIFCTNYYSRIIDPLKSRLLKFKFTSSGCKVLKKIAEKEMNNSFDKNANDKNSTNNIINYVECIFKKCSGDLRKSINIMQGLAALKNIEYTEDLIDSLVGRIPNDIYFKLFNETESFANDFIRDGYSALQLIQQLAETENDDKSGKSFKITIPNITSEKEKSRFYLLLSELEGFSVNGCSDELVINRLVSGMKNIIENN